MKNEMKWTLLALIIGYVLDLCFGDPYWLPHPVRLIGIEIDWLERVVRRRFPKSHRGELAGGVFLVCVVVISSAVIPGFLLWGIGKVHPLIRLAAESWFCYQLLAAKSLKVESMKVYERLKTGSLPEARRAVSMIVGRDTVQLTEEGVAKAAVETIAENTSDGIIAPMFYMALFGAVGGFVYKAVNTMDSMIGYKNERYEYLGKAAARLDDGFNYIPARLSALFMLSASAVLRMDYKNAWKVYKQDRRKSSSPNAGQTESVCAGALNVQLLGDASYFGIIHHKPEIGNAERMVSYEDIRLVNRLMYCTSFLGLIAMVSVKIGIFAFLSLGGGII